MITSITAQALRTLQEEVLEAVQAVAQRHGVSLTTGRGTYSNGATGKLTLEVATITTGEDGQAVVQSREAVAFQRYAPLFGLAPTDLHREFVSGGDRFRVTGLRPKAPKRPVLALNLTTGREHIFPADNVKAFLARPA